MKIDIKLFDTIDFQNNFRIKNFEIDNIKSINIIKSGDDFSTEINFPRLVPPFCVSTFYSHLHVVKANLTRDLHWQAPL